MEGVGRGWSVSDGVEGVGDGWRVRVKGVGAGRGTSMIGEEGARSGRMKE